MKKYTYIFWKKNFFNLQIINAGEGVEKREPSYAVGGNANGAALWRQYGGFLKILK